MLWYWDENDVLTRIAAADSPALKNDRAEKNLHPPWCCSVREKMLIAKSVSSIKMSVKNDVPQVY